MPRIERPASVDELNEARNSGLEEAADICDTQAALSFGMYRDIRLDLAKAIRALKTGQQLSQLDSAK